MEALSDSTEPLPPTERRRAVRPVARARTARPAAISHPGNFRALQRTLITGVGLYLAFALYIAFGKDQLLEAVCGTTVILLALIPTILWVTGRAKGYPLLPLFCFCYTYTFGIQFLWNVSILRSVGHGDLIFACLSLCAFLLLATAIWYPFVRKARPAPRTVRMLEGTKATGALLTFFFLYTVFQMIEAAGQGWAIFGTAFSLVRSLMYSLGALSTFAICYSLGQRKLSSSAQIFYITLFVLAMAAGSSRLILIQTMSMCLLSILGFTLGRKSLPWKVIFLVVPLFVLLNYGKYSMRELTWTSSQSRMEFRLMPWEYPRFYALWMSKSLEYGNEKPKTFEKRADLLDRVSLLQMFIFIHQLSPRTIPFIGGETYSAILPSILPRIFFPNKVSALESTNLISIHYGLQSREATNTTTIGWGLFAEAFANFGTPGILSLGVILGLFFGWATRFTMGYPILSARGLFAVVLMSTAFQTEYTAATAVSATFQAIVLLALMSLVFMRPMPVPASSLLMSGPEFIKQFIPPRRSRPRPRPRPRRLSM